MITAYIREQRDRFFVIGRPLSDKENSALVPFFGMERLRRVRIHRLRRGELPNPSFYPSLRNMGFTDLPDFSNMAAITFVDTIAFHSEVTMPVLFHELVHVVQYDVLGVDRFAERYVTGFINGGGYDGIPLEKNAYDLDVHFSADQTAIFDVEAIVREWSRDGRF